jgi:hypothetical protein
MSGKLSRFNEFPFLLTSILIIALPIVVPAGAATVDDVLKNIRGLPAAQRKAVIEETPARKAKWSGIPR